MRVAAHASADIERAKRLSARKWGVDHARRYIDALEARFVFLAGNHRLGTPRDDLYPGLRSFPQGAHVIYYQMLDGDLRVVRVLHRRMNAVRHLSMTLSGGLAHGRPPRKSRRKRR